jgi:N-acetylmuramic acid 6-phosphate etherase
MPESELFKQISNLETETRNPVSENIDMMSTSEILNLINSQDSLVPIAVEKEIPNIEKAVDLIVSQFKKGGRLFYVGAGTSGRLGIVDASECPPTFGTDPEMVQGIIAGGDKAVFKAQEGAEDSEENGANEIIQRKINHNDVVCGIAASGRTPFVKGAVNYAKKNSIPTIMISTVPVEKVKSLGIESDIYICPIVGPEVITGSTRMKSGTAQKLVLNMLTSASMVKLGKTLGNVMIDLQLTNLKLRERAKKIIMTITDLDYDSSEILLNKADGNVKTALVMHFAGIDKETALEKIKNSDGFVKKAINF